MGELVEATALGTIPGIHPLPNLHRPYCSLGCKHYAPIQTIEQGERLIQEIFQRTPLCWHAVDSINRIYQQIVHIEQRRDVEADINSVNILQLIMDRVVHITQTVFQEQRTLPAWKRRPHDIISYHFLRNFLTPELRVENLNRPLPLLDKVLQCLIAPEIPCCGSVEQFEQDVDELLGKECDDIIESHVEKKEQIAALEQGKLAKTLDINDCKQELSILRQQGLHYPAYYDVLVEDGFTNLYRYLNELRTLDSHESKKAKISSMSFVQIFQVMYETYEVLMQSVEQSVGPNPDEVVLLVGDTGVGKTTAFCAITGKTLKLRKDDLYDLVDESDNMIGHGDSSCTFLPNVHLTDGKAIVDFPGLRDTNGWPISLIIELVLLTLANKYHSKILVLESITNDSGRYQGVAELATRLENIFGTKEKLILGITKYSQDKDFEKKQAKRRERENSCAMYREFIKEVEESIQNLQETIQNLENNIQKLPLESSLSAEDIQKQINTWKLQLHDNQKRLGEKITSIEERAKQLELLSKESQEELACQARIEKKEVELRKAFGSHADDPFIRLFNLESQETIEDIRTQLFEWEVRAHSSPSVLRIDPSMKESLIKHFQEQFVPSLEFQKRRFKNINSFGASVLNIGLTATVSSPVVWQVLNLPGMAPPLADQFDKELLDVCINGFMKMIFSDPKVTYLRQLVVSLREQHTIAVQPAAKKLMDKWQTLEAYIVKFLGLSYETNPEEGDRQWEALKKHYAIIPAKQKLLPDFLWVFLPIRVYSWIEEKIKTKVEAQSSERNLLANKRAITEIERNLLGLQQLKAFLNKKDEIDQTVNNASFSFDGLDQFFGSVERLIEQVRQISGVDDWDKRIHFLTDAFLNSDLHHSLNSQSSCVLVAALLSTFLELEVGEDGDTIIIKESGSDLALNVRQGWDWPTSPIIRSFEKLMSEDKRSGSESAVNVRKYWGRPSLFHIFTFLTFCTWNISDKSLTPLVRLQLIDCVMKSGVHQKSMSDAEREGKHAEKIDLAVAFSDAGCFSISLTEKRKSKTKSLFSR